MAELRSVDPTLILPNPDQPRRTAAPTAMDDQLLGSIKAVGIIQPPRVKETPDGLMIVTGDRRRQQAIRAGLTHIDVLVCTAEETLDAMRSMSENLIRASMNSVDIWRATQALEAQGWNEEAIADALALPVRTIKKLKLLARLHPPMLDIMAIDMPRDDQLRTIAAATLDEQAQVWKKNKPKKGEALDWYTISQALSRRHIPFTAAKFGDDLSKAYGVVWHEDLFAPGGEDGRYTTNVEGFFGAQQEWLQTNLPERGTLLPTDEYGQTKLPKGGHYTYGKPHKGDLVGHYLDPQSGAIKTTNYRIVKPEKPGQAKGSDVFGTNDEAGAPTKTRPDVTQKGCAMIGDMRTDALHQALRDATIDDHTLLALLVIAFAGANVSVQSAAGIDTTSRRDIAAALTEGGVLTLDPDALRIAARSMLIAVLSCRDNATDSGIVARIGGDAIGATLCLPSMATEEFLSCISKGALERAAQAEGVQAGARAKDTRAQIVERFKDSTYLYPGAVFKLSDDERAKFKPSQVNRVDGTTTNGTNRGEQEDPRASAESSAGEFLISNEDSGGNMTDTVLQAAAE